MSTIQHTSIADLQQLLDTGADDELVFDCFRRLLQSWNLDSAAQGFFGAAGRVCHHRPQLADRVFQLPMACLVQLGVDSVDGVVKYLRCWLDTKKTVLLADAGPDGLRWLEAELPQQRDLLQQLLDVGMRRFPADLNSLQNRYT